ncbi:hypothetical protein HID58_006384 [Brassica napus]|uniref:Phosphoadenosine phosphosulphate reductase domain-containing protein n=1 Tax=Brassica napus TaxID=3708 RepID=A0ABQ8EB86_BRANA|nr:hypothetical protein HID58_006384 [Brassica napus]
MLENASPLEIMDKALETFGNHIAIAISLDTWSSNPETYDEVERHYGIRIEFMFPDSVEVQGLVRNKAWITGQRKDQSPGTWPENPVVQVDPVFQGLDGGAGSLVKWNPVANVERNHVWSFLRAMDVPVNTLHAKGSMDCCVVCSLVSLLSYAELADKLAGSGVKVVKFRADGDQKEFAKQELQLGSFPTILVFPKNSSRPIKDPSEKRDVDSLTLFFNLVR